MDLRHLTPEFAVAPQIALSDVPRAAAMGFTTLINNRPDAEVEPDLSSAAFARAAQAAGLAYHYLPYVPGEMTPELVAAFEAVAGAAQGPVLAWCRSGTRSSHLWAMWQAPSRPLAEILATAAQAGFDHRPLSGLLRLRAQS